MISYSVNIGCIRNMWKYRVSLNEVVPLSKEFFRNRNVYLLFSFYEDG